MKSEVDNFLSSYSEEVFTNAQKLRKVLLSTLPGVAEQLDLPAKIVGYCYGQKYADTICVIIPSKKGLKLVFNRGLQLKDPDKLLEGSGKIARHVVIKSEEQIKSPALKKLLAHALELYKEYKSIGK